ncbi:MAG: hypothetical protein DRN99_07430, partial [Thermoproteota archaeon]
GYSAERAEEKNPDGARSPPIGGMMPIGSDSASKSRAKADSSAASPRNPTTALQACSALYT